MEPIKLDLIDKKILLELDWDARVSDTKLAKIVNLSKKSIRYRIKQLENQKVITGYYPIINIFKLGYLSKRVDLKLQFLNETIKQEINGYLSKEPSIGWIVWSRGSCDLGLTVRVRSLTIFKTIMNNFESKFGEYILEKKFTSVYGSEQYPYSILMGKKIDKTLIINEEKEMYNLDLLELKIIKELKVNARQSYSEIGRKLKINYKTVQNRINKLEKNKVILGARTSINLNLLGYNEYKVLIYFTKYSAESYKLLKNYIKNKIETTYLVYHVDSDLDAEFVFKSNQEFFDFLDELQNNFSDLIKKVEYDVYSKIVQVNFVPDILEKDIRKC